jgi:photosystem II stability/assembly factor-like uncharacterized protein
MRLTPRNSLAVGSISLISALVPLGVFAAPGFAAVGTGHSGWSWGNPTPQGDQIHGLEFFGNRGYAAGRFGTLVRTDDGGSSWSGVATGITQDLARIRIIDSDTLVIAGGCAVRRSDNAGQSFARLPWTASDLNCPSPVTSLAFPSDQVGYLLIANGTVFRTADGGKTWARRTSVPGTPSTGGGVAPTDIFFTSADTGVASAGGQIFRTTDGGGSWTLVRAQAAVLNGLHFVDASNGYAVGAGTSVLKTADGGATWTEKSSGGNLTLTSIRCADLATCLVTVDTGDRLLRTTDGADSFASVTPSTFKVFAAAFASATRAVAAGEFGTTVVSDNAGATWAQTGGRLNANLTRLRAVSSTLAFAPGRDGALARTTDGGASWTLIGVSTSGNVEDAAFVSQSVGYALDSAGSVLKTDNGGTSWQILNTGTNAVPAAIVALDANRVLLLGPRGVRRSTNGGGEFAVVRSRAVRRARLVDYDRAGSSLFTWGSHALVFSRDGGKSWKRLRRPARSSVVALDFVSARRGFALTADGRAWQTRNRGRRWRELPAVGSVEGVDLAFSSTRRGWLTLSSLGGAHGGYVLRTTDSGKSWRPQLVDDDQIQNGTGLVATGDDAGILLALDSSLFTTASGGDAGTPSKLKLKTKKRKLRKRSRIKVTGKLSPAEGGEPVIVSRRDERGTRWIDQIVTVASNGTFTTAWSVKKTALFVAKWAGDDDRAGDGSRVLRVSLKRRGRR